jgi:hypothetical protein
VAVTRLCPFCLLPLATECVCEVDEPEPAGYPEPYDCARCGDTAHVCEDHPARPWGGLCCGGPAGPGPDGDGAVLCQHGACHCGGAGEPCGSCCSPVPADGTRSITDAFTSDGKRM